MKNLYLIPLLIGLMSCSSLFAQKIVSQSFYSFDMEFQKIVPGKMLVGKIEIECPSFPDTRDVPEEIKWTEKDFKLCQEMAESDGRSPWALDRVSSGQTQRGIL